MLRAVRWQSACDFLVLAFAIYFLLRWSREARALRLVLSIVALRVGALLAGQFDLLITNWVLDAFAIVALLALIVVFQPELRHLLMRLDVTGRIRQGGHLPTLATISATAWSLARARCGALIVIVRRDSLLELITSGVALHGGVSAGILEAIFQKGSPVHDGAAIVEGDVITRVSAILPLTQRSHVPSQYGTRHRAGMGLTDRSDALVVVVSEERGEVSLMWEGQVQLIGGVDELQSALTALTTRRSARTSVARSPFRAPEPGLTATTLGLSALVWGLTFLLPGHSVRVQAVPVEFVHVPPGLTITAQSTDSVELWLRGSDFLLDSVNLETLIARCDLAKAHTGLNNIRLQADAVEVPFGLKVEGLAPHDLSVRLTGALPPPSSQ